MSATNGNIIQPNDGMKPEDYGIIIAIDLGSTRSYGAYTHPGSGQPELLQSREGVTGIPSYVQFFPNKTLVGFKPQRTAMVYPDQTFYLVKPKADNENLKLGDHDVIDYFAAIAGYFKAVAEEQFGQEVRACVLTVPNYLELLGRQRMQEGARRAGLEPVRVLQEPTAGLQNYIRENPDFNGVVVVADVGGASIDISAGYVQGKDTEILASAGELDIGGYTITEALLRELEARWKDRFGSSPLSDPQLYADFWERSEESKIDLSSHEDTDVFLSGDGNTMTENITQSELEEFAKPVTNVYEESLKAAINKAGYSPDDVDVCVMVGGPTRMDIFQRITQQILPSAEISYPANPTEAVVKGAAVQAGRLMKIDVRTPEGSNFLFSEINDVTARGLGVTALDDNGDKFNRIIIPANEQLPAEGEAEFLPSHDDANLIGFDVNEGDSEDLNDVKAIVSGYQMKIRTPTKKGNKVITVRFRINEDGLIELDVWAQDGSKLNTTIKHPAIREGSEPQNVDPQANGQPAQQPQPQS